MLNLGGLNVCDIGTHGGLTSPSFNSSGNLKYSLIVAKRAVGKDIPQLESTLIDEHLYNKQTKNNYYFYSQAQ